MKRFENNKKNIENENPLSNETQETPSPILTQNPLEDAKTPLQQNPSEVPSSPETGNDFLAGMMEENEKLNS